jgi:hypothetical protein
MMYKHLVWAGAAVLLTLSQSAFKSKATLSAALQGDWKVDKITYTLSTGDSTAQSPAGGFGFGGGNDPAGQQGHYQLDGKTKYPFLYQMEQAELIIAVLSPSGQPLNRISFFGTQPDFSAIWTVTELPGGQLKLNGQAVVRRKGKEETVLTEIRLKK